MSEASHDWAARSIIGEGAVVPCAMTEQLTEDDRGKAVIRGTERIGTVTDVRGNTVYFDPDFDHIPAQLRETLDVHPDDEHHTFEESAVTDVRNDEVHLRDDL